MAAQETNATANSKRRLGRGLNSLIRQGTSPVNAAQAGTYRTANAAGGNDATDTTDSNNPAADNGRVRDLQLDKIRPNPYQPRRDFDPAALAELAESIRQQGVLQPLIVRADDDGYLLIAGERRLRASREAGLHTVPCIVRDASQQQMIEWAMIENIQRADLNPIERAQAYREYMDRFELTQAQVAERLSQPRTTIANHLRILDLHDEVQEFIADGQLSFGHAKILASLSDDLRHQLHLARKIVGEGLSVRRLEETLQQHQADKKNGKGSKSSGSTDSRSSSVSKKPAYVRDVEEQLTQTVGTKVSILPSRKKNQGRIVVDYYSLDDFDRISSLLGLSDADPH